MYDYSGRLLRAFGSNGSDPGQLSSPFGLEIDAANNFLVGDCDNHRVSVFSSKGSFITAFGVRGREPGQLDYTQSVCVDLDGRMFVSDASGHVDVYNERCFVFVRAKISPTTV